MKLISAKVENFKCVEDSTEFSINDVTCLVGKNEAGKTALLEALYKIKPVEIEKKDFEEEEFPRRHLSTYRERQDREPVNVITTSWELEEDDIEEIQNGISPAVLEGTSVLLTKGYSNQLVWNFKIDEKTLVEKYLNEANFDAAEKAPLNKTSSITDLVGKLADRESLTEKQSELLVKLKTDFPGGEPRDTVEKILNNRLPYFVYFSNYHQLPGRVSIDNLKVKKRENKLLFEDKIFLSLLDMANTGLEEIEGIKELEQLMMELEAVEALLTDEIKKYWTQNKHLEVRFEHQTGRPGDPSPFNSGPILNIRIFNTRHRASVSFEDRSHGFIWFFSFLVWFSQVKKQYGENLILLLDEPGLPLHGRAQQDLIKYINERLRPYHQVLYSAHSPFMIDVNHIFSLRTVEDLINISEKDGEKIEEILGTKVGQRILSRDKDTIFPLQGILGFDLAQTLFVGPNVLVVEGPTERSAIEWFSRELVKRGKAGLDIRWAVCPAESASKISSFVSLFSGRGMRIAVLADYHQGQKKMIDNLKESGLLPEGHVLTTKDFTNEEESDIEDVIGRKLYIELVNDALGLVDPYRLPDKKPAGANIRVVKEVEAFCRLLPPGYPEFNHYFPIEYLLGLPDVQIAKLPDLGDALMRFETIFSRLNSLFEEENGKN